MKNMLSVWLLFVGVSISLGAIAQQAPRPSIKDEILVPSEMLKNHPKSHIPTPYQVPRGFSGGSESAEQMALPGSAQVALLNAQTNTIKLLVNRIDILEARVQKLEADKRFGSTK